MTVPNVDFVGMTPSPALRAEVERQVHRLVHLAPRLASCHVTVRRDETRHRNGPQFQVHVHATLPGGSFDVGRAPSTDADARSDAYATVRESFRTLRRQVEEFQTLRRDDARGAAVAR